MLTNHHMHTLYSDGNSLPEEYIATGIQKGFSALGFTEHSPLPFDNTFSFKAEKKEEYLSLINSLKTKYASQIALYCAMEVDFVPGMSEDFESLRKDYGLDYLIGSVHLVKPDNHDTLWFTDGPDYAIYDQGIQALFGGDIKKAVGTYYRQINQMIETQRFEIIGHFDKIKMHNRGRFFSEDEKWYKDMVNETIRLIKEKDLIVEVNTRGIYKKRSETTYPGLDILKQLKKLEVPVMINSDAHKPEELDGAYQIAQNLLLESGYAKTVYFKKGEWIETAV